MPACRPLRRIRFSILFCSFSRCSSASWTRISSRRSNPFLLASRQLVCTEAFFNNRSARSSFFRSKSCRPSINWLSPGRERSIFLTSFIGTLNEPPIVSMVTSILVSTDTQPSTIVPDFMLTTSKSLGVSAVANDGTMNKERTNRTMGV